MIINVRGTSGSGKSTLVRRVLYTLGERIPIFRDGRKQPLLYECPKHNTVVLGHYEGERGGGCDTISGFDNTYDLVKYYSDLGWHVLFEGLLLSAEVNRLIEVSKKHKTIIIKLTTPFEECARSVKQRRLDRGNTKPVGPNFKKNLMSKHKGTDKTCERFQDAGGEVLGASREGAYEIITALLP